MFQRDRGPQTVLLEDNSLCKFTQLFHHSNLKKAKCEIKTDEEI